MKYKATIEKLKSQVPAPWRYEARRFFLKGESYTDENGKATTEQAINDWVAGGDRRRAVIRRIRTDRGEL